MSFQFSKNPFFVFADDMTPSTRRCRYQGTGMVALVFMLIAGLLPLASSFHCGGAARGLLNLINDERAISINTRREVSTSTSLAMVFNDDFESSWEHRSTHLAIFVSSFLLAACASPQLAQASSPDDATSFFVASNNQQYEQRLATSSNLLAVDSQGLPFASTFQLPGAVPDVSLPKRGGGGDFQADRDARNRAYDEAFQKDARDRDEYYGKMALQKKEQALVELQERRGKMGLDDAGSRFANVATMDSLTQYLMQKDPTTMTPAEFKEFKILQRKAELQDSIKAIQADKSQEAARIQAITNENTVTRQEVVDASVQRQESEKQEFQAKVQAKQQELQEIKERKEQDAFDNRMDAIDAFTARKERMEIQRQH
jgi:nitrogen regulatory protein PII-like uncharacterized protein